MISMVIIWTACTFPTGGAIDYILYHAVVANEGEAAKLYVEQKKDKAKYNCKDIDVSYHRAD